MTAAASVLGFVAIPVATSIGGSVLAARRPAGEPVRNIVQHAAAGLGFAAASLELLPDLIREHSTTATVVGFSAGVAVMLPVGAVLGIGPVASLPVTPFAAVLAFATVALLYLVTEELLAEAHEVRDTPLATATLLLGLLGILLVPLSSGGPN